MENTIPVEFVTEAKKHTEKIEDKRTKVPSDFIYEILARRPQGLFLTEEDIKTA